MTDNSSQPGTSTGRGNINTNLSRCNIDTLIQHNHLNSTSSAKIEIDYFPAPISTFLGRSEELGTLKTLLTQHQMVALVGMGGLGKTQLSRKYVQVNKTNYQYRYWLESETPEKLKNSFKELANILNIESDNINKVVNDVYKKIGVVPTIPVFDNVENPADVYEYLPTRVDLPSGVTIHVLVTSRWADWTCDKHIKCYRLQPLSVSESLQIFEEIFDKSCIKTMQDEWKELAKMLDYLPLALQVATSYLYKRTKHNSDLPMVLADYMKQLKMGAAALLNDSLTEYVNRSIYTSMMLTLKQLENKADNVSNVQNDVQWQLAVTLINVVAYMYPDRIERKCLLQLVDNYENICKLDEALAILTEYSLVNQRGGGTIYSVHRIIQSSIRHNPTIMETADKYYIRALKCTFADDYFTTNVLEYANEHASALADYYKDNPSPKILKYLVNNNAITAMEAALKLSKTQIQIAIKEHDLLHRAVGSGHLKMTELLCKYGAAINQLCWNEWRTEPPLHRALRNRNMEIATWLLENGAAPTLRDREGRNALQVAIAFTNHKMVSTIIKSDRAVVNKTDDDGRTPLLAINYYDNEEDIFSTTRVLVESGADITAVDKDGNNVLHSVSSSACAAAVSLILQLSNDLINIENEDGETALHVIPYHITRIDDDRILSAMRVLIKGGVDFTKVAMRGNTVLHSAAKGARAAAVSLILQINNDLINIKNKNGETVLHVIPYNERSKDDERILSTIRVLVDSGVDLTKVNVEGNTVLHLAAKGARVETVTLILKRNKDLINFKNKDGETALHVIPYNYIPFDNERILSTIRVLLESGVDPTKEDIRGNTVLHTAVKSACVAAVSLILQQNKDLINIKNKNGESALHVLVTKICGEDKYDEDDFKAFKETARMLIWNGLSLDTRDSQLLVHSVNRKKPCNCCAVL